METKYDSYYDRKIPYTMTFDELYTLTDRGDGKLRFNEENVLAYIRQRGDKFRMIAPVSLPDENGFLSCNEYENVLCKIDFPEDDSDLFNPFYVSDFDAEEGRWYHAHKMCVSPIDFPRFVQKMYVMDFVSLLNSGSIIIEEWDDVMFEEDT